MRDLNYRFSHLGAKAIKICRQDKIKIFFSNWSWFAIDTEEEEKRIK